MIADGKITEMLLKYRAINAIPYDTSVSSKAAVPDQRSVTTIKVAGIKLIQRLAPSDCPASRYSLLG